MRPAALLLLLSASAAYAQPETRGPHPITDFDAGRVNLAGVQIPVHVYHPSDIATPLPVVAVVHGYQRNGSFMAEMARTLASRGMVAVVPDMPCGGIAPCDHNANAEQLRALLLWAAADPVISGRVDPTKRAIIGHSWGALSTFIATTRAGDFEAAVLLDANDDRGLAAGIAAQAAVPTAQVRAEISGNCNSMWTGGIFTAAPVPKLDVRIKGAAHCDAEEPSDNFCPILCGRGDPTKSALFRRYAVAFVSCILTRDPAVAPWVEGTGRAMDEAGGLIDQVGASGLAALPCIGMVPPTDDAGVAAADAASTSTTGDASTAANDDAAAVVHDDASGGVPIAPDAAAGAFADAGPSGASDAAPGASVDAGVPGPGSVDDGCQTVGGSTPLFLTAALLVVILSRKRS